MWCVPLKKRRGKELPQRQHEIKHRLSQLRARAEYPFRLVKRQFGFTNVRYRGLAKNTAQLTTPFALSNLYLVRRQLLEVTGYMCPKAGKRPLIRRKKVKTKLNSGKTESKNALS